jgi:hypothetical protein
MLSVIATPPIFGEIGDDPIHPERHEATHIRFLVDGKKIDGMPLLLAPTNVFIPDQGVPGIVGMKSKVAPVQRAIGVIADQGLNLQCRTAFPELPSARRG